MSYEATFAQVTETWSDQPTVTSVNSLASAYHPVLVRSLDTSAIAGSPFSSFSSARTICAPPPITLLPAGQSASAVASPGSIVSPTTDATTTSSPLSPGGP